MSNNVAVITGAGGMDAKTLTHFLLSKNYKVVLTYRRNTFFDENKILSIFEWDLKQYPKSELYLQVCDISCQNSVKECIKSVLKDHSRIDELYLLAANSHVGESFKNKELSIQTNGQSVYYFLESLKQLSPKTRTYFAGTSELAGGVESGTFNEDSTWNPRSPYAIGKALGARWVNFYRDCLDSRMFCCYGILFNHSNIYRSKDFVIRKITNAAAKISLGIQTELKLGHLEWARDEHWSDFGCEAMWKMLQLDEPECFTIGNGETRWGEEYLDAAFEYFNLDWKKYVKFDESLKRPNEVVRLIADSTKAQKKLGWIPNRIPFNYHIQLMCTYDYNLESGGIPIRPDVFSEKGVRPPTLTQGVLL
jgi:GDPmannose 4,6-dehydratase